MRVQCLPLATATTTTPKEMDRTSRPMRPVITLGLSPKRRLGPASKRSGPELDIARRSAEAARDNIRVCCSRLSARNRAAHTSHGLGRTGGSGVDPADFREQAKAIDIRCLAHSRRERGLSNSHLAAQISPRIGLLSVTPGAGDCGVVKQRDKAKRRLLSAAGRVPADRADHPRQASEGVVLARAQPLLETSRRYDALLFRSCRPPAAWFPLPPSYRDGILQAAARLRTR